jgi:S1-C subfamily serine protease
MRLRTEHPRLLTHCAALGLFCIILSRVGFAAEIAEIGQPMPLGTLASHSPTPIPIVYEWQSEPGAAISAKRVAEVLSSPALEEGRTLTRGGLEIKLYKKTSPSVVLIVTEKSSGSGSYIGSNLILTNWHVVGDAGEVGILFKPQREGDKLENAAIVRGSVVKANTVRDLALVRVSLIPPYVRALEFSSLDEIQVGADVHAIGHPKGEAWTYTKGIISQVRRDFEWQSERSPHRATVIQTQTPINPGNSGGPLLDNGGKVLGVNSFKAADAENLNFAVSVEDVLVFLKVTSQPKSQPTDRSKPACEMRRLYEGRDPKHRAALVNFDTDCDGKVDSSLIVPDKKSEPVKLMIDRNSDGNADIVVLDTNRDGKWDVSFHDVNFDDVTDLVGFHPDGKLQPSRYEKYAAR